MTDLVYILSPSYSGSTLLTFLLGTHPEVATIGELKATARGDMDTYQCSCGTRMLDCAFWARVKAEMERRDGPFDLADFGTHFRAPQRAWEDKLLRTTYRGGAFEPFRRAALRTVPRWHRDLDAILERNRALMETVLSIQGGSRFLDGSKDAVRLMLLRACGPWNVKVVRLIRDGRGSTNSYMRIHKLSIERASEVWRNVQEECERLAGDLPADSCLSVRYEDLCADVDGVLAKIFGFLGLDPAAATKDFLGVEHHILGHAMRIRTNGRIELNEKWKQAWSAQDRSTFERVAGDLNRRYGYE